MMEATWLAVVIIIPVFFNPAFGEVFDSDKVALLRGCTALRLVAWLVRAVDHKVKDPAPVGGRGVAAPIQLAWSRFSASSWRGMVALLTWLWPM